MNGPVDFCTSVHPGHRFMDHHVLPRASGNRLAIVQGPSETPDPDVPDA